MRGATTVGLSAAPGLSGLWVFGYGSLVWKPPAGAEQNTRLVGYVEGYRRVWCQASTDHRGTPEAPGSVVTLVPDETPGARVWGIAARLSDSDDALELARIIADLDYREKQYDTRLQLPVHAEGGVLLERCITVRARARRALCRAARRRRLLTPSHAARTVRDTKRITVRRHAKGRKLGRRTAAAHGRREHCGRARAERAQRRIPVRAVPRALACARTRARARARVTRTCVTAAASPRAASAQVPAVRGVPFAARR